MERQRNWFAFIAVLMIGVFTVAGAVEKTEKIEKSFRFKDAGGENLLIVDNVWGDISVTGAKGQNIEMTVYKKIEASTSQSLEEAREEVYLDIAEEDDVIELYVDGPFRDSGRRSRGRRGWERRHYEVRYDFDLRVPAGVRLELSTVNDGEITVTDFEGDYDIHNVNGGIELEKMDGSGEVYAVNGDVTIDFMKNPREDCRFGTLNGELRLYFQPSLSADFQLKTFNGEIFSDFPVTYLPAKPETSVKKKGKYVYKTGQTMGVRAGKGGPEILLDGFNGDMFILDKKKH